MCAMCMATGLENRFCPVPQHLKMEGGGPLIQSRFEVVPRVKVGVLTLQRKRPWPSCPNPQTGNQWSQDMKDKVVEVLDQQTRFQVVYAPQDIQVVDDASLRKALGKS